MHPTAVLEHPNKLSAQGEANLRASKDEYVGLGAAHRLMLLEEGMKFTKISINPADSQFLETRKFQKSEIVDIFFGMPLTLLHSGEATPTYASAEQFALTYIVYALAPWLVNIEKAIRRDLLTEEERKEYYAKFSVGALLRGDIKARFEAYGMGIEEEILNPNECRDLEDLNPYIGGDRYGARKIAVAKPAQGGA